MAFHLPITVSQPQTCAFCSATKDLTVDHIPPKCLFPEGSRTNLITVRSCKNHNSGTSDDEQYFRDHLTLWNATADQEQAKAVAKKMLRSWRRPEQRAYTQSIRERFVSVPRFTPGGIYVGRGKGVRVDINRFQSVVGKTVRGLFYHESSERVPDDYVVATPLLVNEIVD